LLLLIWSSTWLLGSTAFVLTYCFYY
jgi:hypothetical protein